MKNKYHNKCRVCGSLDLSPVFYVGDFFVSDFIDKPDSSGRTKAPLELVECKECSLVQLTCTAPQELMYEKHYWYRSGLSQVILDDLKDIVEEAIKIAKIKENEIFLDIGANDGSLLSFVPRKFIRAACEPAENLHDECYKHCDVLLGEFWSSRDFILAFGSRKAKIITAIGMFYDMDDPGKFVKDAAAVLDDNGVFIAQLMTLQPMLDNYDLGNICHEHIEYYSYASLVHLFENNGLEIFRVEGNRINGGSYRIYARKLNKGSLHYKEQRPNWNKFIKGVNKNKEQTLEYLLQQKKMGAKIYGYGASTKGNTYLQYYGIGPEILDGIADKSCEKIDLFTVGTHINIVGENEARREADIFLVLPYAFRDAFIEREKQWLKSGGKFVFTTPKFEVYDKNSSASL